MKNAAKCDKVNVNRRFSESSPNLNAHCSAWYSEEDAVECH